MKYFKQMTVTQVENGITVVMQNHNGFGNLEWVFSDIKAFKAFMGKQFLDAAAIEKIEEKEAAAEKRANHNEKA